MGEAAKARSEPFPGRREKKPRDRKWSLDDIGGGDDEPLAWKDSVDKAQKWMNDRTAGGYSNMDLPNAVLNLIPRTKGDAELAVLPPWVKGDKKLLRDSLKKAGGTQGLLEKVVLPPKGKAQVGSKIEEVVAKGLIDPESIPVPSKTEVKKALKEGAADDVPDLKAELKKIFEQGQRGAYVNKLNKKLKPLIKGEGPLPLREEGALLNKKAKVPKGREGPVQDERVIRKGGETSNEGKYFTDTWDMTRRPHVKISVPTDVGETRAKLKGFNKRNQQRPKSTVTLKGTTIEPKAPVKKDDVYDIADDLASDPINDPKDAGRDFGFDADSVDEGAKVEIRGRDEENTLSILERDEVWEELKKMVKPKKGVSLERIRAGDIGPDDVTLAKGVDEKTLREFVKKHEDVMDDTVRVKAKESGYEANGKSGLSPEEISADEVKRLAAIDKKRFRRKDDPKIPDAIEREIFSGDGPKKVKDPLSTSERHRDSKGRQFVVAVDDHYPVGDPRRIYREYNDPKTMTRDNPRGRPFGSSKIGDVNEASAKGRLSGDAPLKLGYDMGEKSAYIKKGGIGDPDVESILDGSRSRARFDDDGEGRRATEDAMTDMGLRENFYTYRDSRMDDLESLYAARGNSPDRLKDAVLSEYEVEKAISILEDAPAHKKVKADDFGEPLSSPYKRTAEQRRVDRRVQKWEAEELAKAAPVKSVEDVKAARVDSQKSASGGLPESYQLEKGGNPPTKLQAETLNGYKIPKIDGMNSRGVSALIGQAKAMGTQTEVRNYFLGGGKPSEFLKFKSPAEFKAAIKAPGVKSIDDVAKARSVSKDESVENKRIEAKIAEIAELKRRLKALGGE